MSRDRVPCAGLPIYHESHPRHGTSRTATAPDGRQYDPCSEACLLSFANYDLLPTDLNLNKTETPEAT